MHFYVIDKQKHLTRYLNIQQIQRLERVFANFLEEQKILPNSVCNVEVSLTFVEIDEITSLNEMYRDLNEATDVLSFPFWESEDAFFEPPLNWSVLPLGDIVICHEIVKQNDEFEKISSEKELILVIFHSLLHLIGFNHNTSENEKKMWDIQDHLTSECI